MISPELRQRIATLTGIELDPMDLQPPPASMEPAQPMMAEPMMPPQPPGMAPAERERLMMLLQMMGGQQ